MFNPLWLFIFYHKKCLRKSGLITQPSGVTWVDGLRASVRPVITYAFFLLFTTVKVSALYVLVVDQGIEFVVALPQIWDPETQALFAAVMSFWFGQRALAKARG